MNQKELQKKYIREVVVNDCKTVFQEMQDIKDWKKEVFVVFYLNTQNQIISREVISIGILNSVIIHAREVYRTAIIQNAHAIIVSHNHPCGSSEPSAEDKDITNQLKKAGNILGIKLLDHVIVTKKGYYSFVEQDKF